MYGESSARGVLIRRGDTYRREYVRADGLCKGCLVCARAFRRLLLRAIAPKLRDCVERVFSFVNGAGFEVG